MSQLRYLLLACFLLMLPTSQALSARAAIGEKPPKALFVELLTRKNQVDYMKKNNPARVAEIMKDINSVMKATLLDFSMNFDYIPVYFFVDTNAERIQRGEFAGVLLDEQMNPVAKPAIQDGDTSFFVAYFGSYMPQPHYINPQYTAKSVGLGGYHESAGDDPTALKKTLLVMDHNFELLRLPKPRTPRTYVTMSRRENRKLFYRSKNTEIDYVPLAASYDATLRRYYRPRKVYAVY